ncbi:MAG TPA: HAMP domain-containing sensor histidine kinase, partial [Candidatus Goldiibacteriota bacterium]|nr:HAMP domain-containing sensor histidine kinase [Candidatus Goldiibacteriota bacterium]
LFISSKITRSINMLKRKAEEIAKRNFDEDIKVNGEEEINVLSATLDNMKNELKEYILNRERMATAGEFSAGVAHEIRNSLNVISGYAELIKSRTKDEYVLTKTDDILKNITKMSGFLNNFLSYTREYLPEKQDCDLKELLNEIISECENDVKKIVKRKYDGKIMKVFVDGFLIKKAVHNVILNAYQSLDKQEKVIEIDCFEEADRKVISIKDNGMGIDDDMKDKIFKPFGTNKKYGAGLGLAISYRIIRELHNGDISVESKKGEGSVFKIYIK